MPETIMFKAFILLISTGTFASSQLTYDFIVVGAGAGGCAVTSRLVENNFNVLLIESGGLSKEEYDIPGMLPQTVYDPNYSFQYQSIRPPNSGSLFPMQFGTLTGRMLGGTTSLNFMWFNRGSPQDFNNWSNLTSDKTWEYSNMLKYMKRSENYKGDYPSNQHGYGGPITISRPRYAPGLNYWLSAGRELGYPVGDPNNLEAQGFSAVEFSKNHGRRVSAYVGYLGPLIGKPNLKILTNINVTKVVFQGKRAVGVSFFSNHLTSEYGFPEGTAYASKEIIISAGGFNSPLILQRSGIGPEHVLEAAGIAIVKPLPTGLNLQNHGGVRVDFFINNTLAVTNASRDLTPENLEFFHKFGDGPYSNTLGATGQAMVASSVAAANGEKDWPDLHLFMSHSTEPFIPGYPLDTAANNQKDGEISITAPFSIGRPKSRGTIQIDPLNIYGHPILDLGYLTDARDVEIMLYGIKETIRIFENTSAYRAIGARYASVILPACDEFRVRSDSYWRCYIRHSFQGGCHPSGTNKMGKATDPTAVVDNELRVIGIDGLRVVDASIMPFIINTNPQAAVYAIAEKTAELILTKWTRNVSLNTRRGRGWGRRI